MFTVILRLASPAGTVHPDAIASACREARMLYDGVCDASLVRATGVPSGKVFLEFSPGSRPYIMAADVVPEMHKRNPHWCLAGMDMWVEGLAHLTREVSQ